MDVNPYADEDKEQRRRIIIVATTIAIIILGIAVWSIIAIVGGSKSSNVSTEPTSQVAVDDGKSKSTQIESQPTESTAPTSEGVSTTTQTNSTASQARNTANTANTVPETGPEELLPLALVAGGLVAYVSSRKLALREA